MLELALDQGQAASCAEIVGLAEAGRVHLIAPAFSLAEPWEPLRRRHLDRRRLSDELDREFQQLTRTTGYAAMHEQLQGARALLVDSVSEEIKRLEQVQARLLSVCEIIPLGRDALAAAANERDMQRLSPQDSLVYASVLLHLTDSPTQECCFLNRNSKDFSKPDIVDELNRHACRLIPRFDHGVEYIRSRI